MISVHALSKRYGSTPIVQDVSFVCEPGTVTGFLGPNGAGKSTTLRMMTGLTRSDAGHALIDGRPFGQLANPQRVVGTLLDPSAMHPGRTGRAALKLAANLAGVPGGRVSAMLDAVGLSGAASKRRIGAYSLGMRQRLGLAQALIGDPHILILDEPANGLDPEGIAWMRTLLREFAEGGGTVLLSSHLLAEVEATVDRLVMIVEGRVVADGPVSTLLKTSGLAVRATDSAALQRILGGASIPFTPRPDGSLMVHAEGDVNAESISRRAMASGVVLVELRPAERLGLEELFFSLTRKRHDAPAHGRFTQEVAR